MSMIPSEYNEHYPVLLKEVLENLSIKDGGSYLDCTFGAGGYSNAILSSADCHLTSLDQDENVAKFVAKTKENFGDRFSFIRTNFAEAPSVLSGKKFDGIVMDIGVSSMQLDQAERGFSFMKDGPLDMRMNKEFMSAEEFVNETCEEEIADIIYKYGEEVQSRAIAKAIVNHRKTQPIKTTLELAEIVRESMHFRNAKIDPATKTFQAIRIHINKELESLEKILAASKELLKDNGRLVVVSFHSLEDSIVKDCFKTHSAKKVSRSKYAKPEKNTDPNIWLRTITKKPIIPSKEEVRSNVRSRSAKMRVSERLGGDDVA
ncbi:MAG: hypothetical protein DGJ47_000582 [Rickettsiaceae bacterium]